MRVCIKFTSNVHVFHAYKFEYFNKKTKTSASLLINNEFFGCLFLFTYGTCRHCNIKI